MSLTLPTLSGTADDAGAAKVYGGSETEGDERQTFKTELKPASES